jgi:hypothetical protein
MKTNKEPNLELTIFSPAVGSRQSAEMLIRVYEVDEVDINLINGYQLFVGKQRFCPKKV